MCFYTSLEAFFCNGMHLLLIALTSFTSPSCFTVLLLSFFTCWFLSYICFLFGVWTLGSNYFLMILSCLRVFLFPWCNFCSILRFRIVYLKLKISQNFLILIQNTSVLIDFRFHSLIFFLNLFVLQLQISIALPHLRVFF